MAFDLIQKDSYLFSIYWLYSKFDNWLGFVDIISLNIVFFKRNLMYGVVWSLAVHNHSNIYFSELISINWNINIFCYFLFFQDNIIFRTRLLYCVVWRKRRKRLGTWNYQCWISRESCQENVDFLNRFWVR